MGYYDIGGQLPPQPATKPCACGPVPTPILAAQLQENGAKIDAVDVRTLDVPSAGRPLDVVVAGEGRWWGGGGADEVWDDIRCKGHKEAGRRAGVAQEGG